MKNLLLLLCILMMAPAILPAQEILVSDTGFPTLVPFQGSIKYAISVTLKEGPEVKDFMADTCLLTVAQPWVHLQYQGGIADSTMSRIRWNASEGETQILYPPGGLYYTTPASYQPPVAKVRKLGEKANIAGIFCEKYQVTYSDDAGRDLIWASDSLPFPKNEADTALLYRPLFLHPDIPGIPLKMTRTEGRNTVTMTAVEVLTGKVEDDFFAVPEKWGYRIFNPRSGDRFPILKDRDKK